MPRPSQTPVERMNVFDAQVATPGELERRVSRLLLSFDLDPYATLGMLRHLGGYISGSAALLVLVPGAWQPKDIDIYVPSEGAQTFKTFLLLSYPRQFVLHKEIEVTTSRRKGSTYTNLPGLSEIWYFRSQRNGRDVNVMVTSTKSALAPILSFHSTAVMNVITYFGLVSLYAKATIQGIGWVNLKGYPSIRDLKWMLKYRRRGFHIFRSSALSGVPHRCGSSVLCTQTERSLFDNGVRVAKFTKYEDRDSFSLLRTLETVFVWRLKNWNCHEEAAASLL